MLVRGGLKRVCRELSKWVFYTFPNGPRETDRRRSKFHDRLVLRRRRSSVRVDLDYKGRNQEADPVSSREQRSFPIQQSTEGRVVGRNRSHRRGGVCGKREGGGGEAERGAGRRRVGGN